MNTDPVADYLTRIRNANQAGLKTVEIPSSNLKVEITKILLDQGFILNYKVLEDNLQGKIKIALKYDKITNDPVIKKLQRAAQFNTPLDNAFRYEIRKWVANSGGKNTFYEVDKKRFP